MLWPSQNIWTSPNIHFLFIVLKMRINREHFSLFNHVYLFYFQGIEIYSSMILTQSDLIVKSTLYNFAQRRVLPVCFPVDLLHWKGEKYSIKKALDLLVQIGLNLAKLVWNWSDLCHLLVSSLFFNKLSRRANWSKLL